MRSPQRRVDQGRPWDACAGRGPFGQARWFAELHSISREIRALGPFTDVSEWITLDTVGSALLWTHLGQAAALGVPLVGTTKHFRGHARRRRPR